MSKILGVIAEYNPFHNGHLFHLEKSKEFVDPDYTVCIMSGNFVQRGDTSIIDKWSKTEMALKMGVDLVVELPTVYSICSAENFAEGAIKLLSSFGNDVTLSFGSECGNISILKQIANILYDEPKEYLTILQHELSKGISYPKARENALMFYLGDVRKYANILSSPNNILGIEYLKAMKKLKSNISAITIKRTGTDYNSNEINENFASATAIRNLIKSNKNISEYLPKSSLDILNQNIKYGKTVTSIASFEKEIIYTLRKMSIDEIANLPDVSEGLEFAIKSAVNQCNTITELLSIINTKRYTQTRLKRIFLYALLGITKKDMQISKTTKPYIRILGFNSKGRKLISEISKHNRKLTIISSVKKFMDSNSNKNLKLMLEKDIWATNVYTLGYEYDSIGNLDYTHNLVIKK